MKELSIERMEVIQGGFKQPSAECVLKSGLEGAIIGGVGTAITGAFIPAGILGGWLGGVVAGLVMCSLD